MSGQRLDVRLDPEHRKKLDEIAEHEGVSLSEIVRRMIDVAYEADRRRRGLEIIRRLAELNIEDVPDPDELSRQLARKYDFENLH